MSEKEYLILVGKNISRIRKFKKLTLKELGILCEIEYSNLIPIEKGKVNFTFNSLFRIASALEVSITDLFKESA